jgi:virulence-associated protein VagC
LSTDNGKTPPFLREMKFQYGALEAVAPGLRRIVCRNPSAFTFKGTNLYVLGQGRVAVIDPGPASGDQLDVLESALKGEKSHSYHSDALSQRS